MFKRSVATLTRGVVDTVASMRVKNLAIYTELKRQAALKAAREAAALDTESVPVVEDLALQIAKAVGDAVVLGSRRAIVTIRPGDKLAVARLQYSHWVDVKTILKSAKYNVAQSSVDAILHSRGRIPMFRVYHYGYERIGEHAEVLAHAKKEKENPDHWRTYEVSL